ncbi:MAG: beta-galactosidase trimerization domain-containing protein, partial [Anaerolineae bacterium]|nr:beta-galactosidase trimerization domain-containing protein [Anaerolineae bacterium]
DYLGMTGKFQTSWGDFHSFKNQAALEFECFHMLALNAKCCVGDQLLPGGRICPHTYDLIGKVYAQVAEKEPWCAGATQVAEIGVLTPEEFDPSISRGQIDFKPIMGATRMLQEGGYQFDILDSHSDFDRYKLLILPDKIPVDETLGARLKTYQDDGGALIASFASGMDAGQTEFTFDLGVVLNGEGVRDLQGNLVRGREFHANDFIDYIIPRETFDRGLPRTEHAMYMRGMDVTAGTEAIVLADVVASYFDRTYRHFCSHGQTPSSGQVVGPAVVQTGRSIYFCHPIFSQYQTRAPRWCKQLFFNALERLLPEPLVRLDAPTATIATLNSQEQHNRLVLHLLYYVPERRCEQFDVIEDVVPLYDVPVSVKVKGSLRSVRLVPQDESLPFAVDKGRVTFTVPQIQGHQMIELQQ